VVPDPFALLYLPDDCPSVTVLVFTTSPSSDPLTGRGYTNLTLGQSTHVAIYNYLIFLSTTTSVVSFVGMPLI
jgi:hypothetical protein